jgi:DNA-binding NarL/FixJ family response regulator
LAARQAWRDFQAGELRLLALAVVLAVAALTAVAFFADRLNTGLARDARQLLGGDAVVASDQPAPAALAQRAQALGRTLNVRLQVRGFDAIAQLVEAGLGVAVLPAVVAQRFAQWGLTPAEADVALFALKGFDIAGIADLRGAAQGTVRAQLTQVYSKAGVSSRAGLVALFFDDLLDGLPAR